MKKFVSLTLAALMMVTSAYGAGISVNLDNENVEFESQQPVIVEGRTLIPLRGVFEKLGYEITWDAQSKTAVFVKEGTEVKVTVNADSFTVNGEENVLDVPAQIINGSMMLPLRAVGEAAGLDVSWDGESKTVSLFTDGAESTTEITTEITTESVTEQETSASVSKTSDIPEDELEILQSAADFYVTYFSIEAMIGSMAYAEHYHSYKIGGAMEYSYSENELKELIEEAIEECNMYKTAAENMNNSELSEDIVKKYISAVDATINYYEFMRDSIFTSKYDDLNEKQFNAKIESASNAIESSIYNLITVMMKSEEDVWETVGESKYNAGDIDKLDSDDKAARDKYCSEIGKTVESAMSFLDDYSTAVESSGKFKSAAGTIRNKLQSTETPDICVFDREIMISCCDLLEKAGESVDKGAFTKDGNNVEYIEFEYSMFTFDVLYKAILGDEYEMKFFDEYSEDSDTEILDDIESRFV